MGFRNRRAFTLGRRAFTLVELLVVIGIIAILVGILLPVLNRARASANDVKCKANLRQLMTAALLFANEHKAQLPGNWWDRGRVNPDERDFLFGNSANRLDAPQTGTLFRYVNGSYALYRCPQRYDVGPGILGPEASNGRFDYAVFLVWAGAKTHRIPGNATFAYANGKKTTVSTPIFCEEATRTINGTNVEGGHCNTDSLGRLHRGGSNYATLDGSVHWFNPRNESRPPRDDEAWDWTVVTRGGGVVTLGEYDAAPPRSLHWGWFNNK